MKFALLAIGFGSFMAIFFEGLDSIIAHYRQPLAQAYPPGITFSESECYPVRTAKTKLLVCTKPMKEK